MIRQLRAWHRRAGWALALLLPPLVVAGLAVRRAPPEVDALPGAGDAAGWRIEREIAPAGADVPRTLLHAAVADPSRRALTVDATEAGPGSETLAYWTAAAAGTRHPLEGAVFLGVALPAERSPLPLPAEASEAPGYLLLYDLAQQKVVARVDLSRGVRRSE